MFKFNPFTGKFDRTSEIPLLPIHGGTGSTTAEFSPTINLTTLHYYVATTGSDSNDGLTIGTPFLTVEKALNSIPLLMGRVYQVNIADGTYNLAAKYTFKTSNAVSGDTDWIGKVIVYGNPTTPNNVKINSTGTSTTAFEVEDKGVAIEFNGVNIANCGIGIAGNNARVIIKNTNINYRTQGILSSYASQVSIPSGNTGVSLISDGISTASAGLLSTVGSSFVIQSPISITGFAGASSGAMQASLNSNINILTSSTITAAAAGARFGIFMSQGGQVLISGGTHNISNITVDSTSSYSGAFGIQASARLSTQSSPTFNITNCLNGFKVGGSLAQVGTATYNYTTVTNKVVMVHGGSVDSNNYLNAVGGTTYTEGFGTQNLFGYDDRYTRTMLGATGGTLGSVAFWGATGLTQDNTNFFWDDTNKRLGLGGVTSPLYTLDVKGAINSQSTPGVAPYNNITYANFVAQNEYNDYPTGKFLIGQTVADVNITLVVAPLYSSAGVQKTASLAISTNKNGVDPNSLQTYIQQTTSVSALITTNRSGSTGAGYGTPFAIQMGTGAGIIEALRVLATNRHVLVGTTTDSSFAQMKIVSGTGVEPLAIMNSVNTGYAFIHMLNNSGVDAAGFGYANASAAVHADRAYFYTVSKEFFISVDNTTTRHFKIDTSGRAGFGMNTTALTARVHIGAGSATAGTAPIKLTAGTNLTAVEDGAVEFDGTNIYITIAGVRKTFVLV